MGIIDWLSDWYTFPSVEVYQCAECGSRFGDAHSACPECGGNVREDDAPEPPHYWGPM